MATLKVSLNGFKELKQRLSKSNLQKEVSAELGQGAEKIRAAAINDAPFGAGGLLRGGIGKEPVGSNWRVFSNALYSGYVEFGTKRKISVPAGLESIAAELKGKSGGGDYFDFLNAILDWVIRKGIANRYSVKTKRAIKIKLGSGSSDEQRLEQTAHAIAISIIRHGIRPHPFFFKQLDKFRPEIIKNVENVLKDV
jgi:hypothetical protein